MKVLLLIQNFYQQKQKYKAPFVTTTQVIHNSIHTFLFIVKKKTSLEIHDDAVGHFYSFIHFD